MALRFGAAVGLVSFFVLAGCATQADLRRVRRQQDEIRAILADQKVLLDSVQRRLDVLRGELEDAKRRGGGGWAVGRLERRIRDLESRLYALETGAALPARPTGARPGEPAAAPLPGETTPPSTGAVAPPSRAAQEPAPVDPLAREEALLASARVDDTYREAFRLFRSGEYGRAIPLFREFLQKNEKSEFADDAQFWIGECYYALGDYNRAILEFNEVLLKYPGSDRVPASLLRQGLAFAELGDQVDARLILQKLVSDYPGTPEARQANFKLRTLRD
ncbi:MAG: hypothetical protein KatS3mg076_0974 [Candidatus Binatia bacterium]|nr:MAG: hypothetical protein KatS3mg076_0974 [Candidatus Binatia bacterium]